MLHDLFTPFSPYTPLPFLNGFFRGFTMHISGLHFLPSPSGFSKSCRTTKVDRVDHDPLNPATTSFTFPFDIFFYYPWTASFWLSDRVSTAWILTPVMDRSHLQFLSTVLIFRPFFRTYWEDLFFTFSFSGVTYTWNYDFLKRYAPGRADEAWRFYLFWIGVFLDSKALT
jgi:hypothetical protein